MTYDEERKYILEALKDMKADIHEIKTEIGDVRKSDIPSINATIAALNVKASMWGGGAGAGAGILGAIIVLFLKFLGT